MPVTVEIHTARGDQYRERVDLIKGNATCPLSDEELKEKFFNCAAYSARPFPGDALKELIEMVEHLECLTDVENMAERMAI